MLKRLLKYLISRLEAWVDVLDRCEGPGASPRSDDPIIDVLHRALGNRTGRLQVSDAFLICGIEPGKASHDQIVRFGKAIRALGWERARRRFDGALQYAYVKGTEVEREVELRVEYDPHMRSVRIEGYTPGQPAVKG